LAQSVRCVWVLIALGPGSCDRLRDMTAAGIDIATNLEAMRRRIASACERAGRADGDVTLVGVSKTHPAATVAEAYAAGLRDFGENRVQEAVAKIDELAARGVRPTWHMIGHLQRNKVPDALRRFDILHSVDSIRLADEISSHAKERVQPNDRVRVLIEVNVAGEASKYGVAVQEAAKLAEHVGRLPHIELAGLMTVAPQVDDPEDVRPVFRVLRELRDSIGLRALSMGMTDDFEVAVEEGSTLVRVGRAIFGPRAV
jgi:PLP dependent protein